MPAAAALHAAAQGRQKASEFDEHGTVFDIGQSSLGPRRLGRQQLREPMTLGPLMLREGEPAGGREQLERFVDAPQHPERFEQPACLFAPIPPVASREHFLGDPLARAEAIVTGTAGKATLTQALMDTTTIRVSEMRAGDASGLVDGKVARPVERQADAAQPGATVAIGAKQGRSHGERQPEGVEGV